MKQFSKFLADILFSSTKWIFYKSFVYFPLVILNHIYSSFIFLSGKNVENLLFGTTIDENGALRFDFFNSDSPLKTIYITMIGIAGGISAILISISIIKGLSKNLVSHKISSGAFKVGGGMLISMVIPIITVSFLSLASTISGVFGSKNDFGATQKDVEIAKDRLTNGIDLIYDIDSINITNYKNEYSWINYVGATGNSLVDGVLKKNEKGVSIQKYHKSEYLNITQNNIFKNIIGWEFISENGNHYIPTNNTLISSNNAAYKLLPFENNNKVNLVSDYTSHQEKILNQLNEIILDESNGETDKQFVDQEIKKLLSDTIEISKSIFDKSHENHIFNFENKKITWSKNIIEQFGKAKNAINKINAGKNQEYGNEIKKLSHNLEDANFIIKNYKSISEALISKFLDKYNLEYIENLLSNILLTPESKKEEQIYNEKEVKIILSFILVKNLEDIHDYFFSQYSKLENKSVSLMDISAKMDKYVLGIDDINSDKFSNGQIVSLNSLSDLISNTSSNEIVVVLFQLVTGKTSTDWTKMPRITEIDSSRLIVGIIAIAFGIFVTLKIAFFSARRIFDIAIFFTLGPVFSVWSAVDDGKRFSNWVEFMIERILSIIAILTSVRVLNILLYHFNILLKNTNLSEYEVGSTSLLKTIILLIFSFSGLLSILYSTKHFSEIFKAKSFNLLSGSTNFKIPWNKNDSIVNKISNFLTNNSSENSNYNNYNNKISNIKPSPLLIGTGAAAAAGIIGTNFMFKNSNHINSEDKKISSHEINVEWEEFITDEG